MGTNYYLKNDMVPTEELHIGKMSAGWVFHFRGHDGHGILNSGHWMIFLRYITMTSHYHIEDEYEERLTFATFCRIVESTRGRESQYEEEKGFYDGSFDISFQEFC